VVEEESPTACPGPRYAAPCPRSCCARRQRFAHFHTTPTLAPDHDESSDDDVAAPAPTREAELELLVAELKEKNRQLSSQVGAFKRAAAKRQAAAAAAESAHNDALMHSYAWTVGLPRHLDPGALSSRM
jgi:hypothetical protein